MTPAYTVKKLTAIKDCAPRARPRRHPGDVLRHRRPVTDPRDPRDVTARMKRRTRCVFSSPERAARLAAGLFPS